MGASLVVDCFNDKNGETLHVLLQERSVVQGYKVQFKLCVVNTSSDVRQFFIKMTIVIAFSKKFHLFSTDATQSYIQSDENLKRKVYIKPCKALELPGGKLLLLNKPSYGLAKCGDYWDRKLE